MDVRIACLFPVKNGAAWPQIIASVRAVNAVYRVLPKITLRRRFLNRFTAQFFEFELIDAARRFEIETDRPRVLTDRQRSRFGEADILDHQLQSEVSLRTGRFELTLKIDHGFDIRRQEGGCPADKFKYIVTE